MAVCDRPDPGADPMLCRAGVTVLPDIYTNAGGVTGSYLECVQNLQHYYSGMRRACGQSWLCVCATPTATRSGRPEERQCGLRTGAFMFAVDRVHRATQARGQ